MALIPGFLALVILGRLHAENVVTAGDLSVDPPTFTCLGFAWEITGDANRNAIAAVSFRREGDQGWNEALPLLRIGGQRVGRTSDWLDVAIPHGLAGSIFDLAPDTPYEVRLRLDDPDGVQGEAEHLLTVRTRAEPRPVEGGRVFHVMPPGTHPRWPQNEFRNLYKAYYGGVGNAGDFNLVWPRPVEPGDTILVHAGTYRASLQHYTDPMCLVSDGTYWLTAKGTAERPIVIKAAGDGEVIFDGAGADVLFNLMAADHHVIEGITFRNAGTAIFAGQQRVGGCTGLVVRRCRFIDVRDGIFTLWNGADGFLIEDCVFEGRNDAEVLTGWGGPEDGYLRSNTAITLQGRGHVVRHNRISRFWQAIHMGTAFQGFDRGGIACDFIGNDLDMLIDDGFELDGGVRNLRVLRNRLMNCKPFSAQPIYGGPSYFIRNVVGNGVRGAFKFHEAHPSGLIAYHNTVVGNSFVGRGLYSNAHFRNNLLLLSGDTGGKRGAMAVPDPLDGTTADYNGYDRGTRFLSTPLDAAAPIMDTSRGDAWWPLKKYPDESANRLFASFEEFRAVTGLEAHGRLIDAGVLKSPPPPVPPGGLRMEPFDVSLAADGDAIDAGMLLPNVNDGFQGDAPDLGAYELGMPIPVYGPRAIEETTP